MARWEEALDALLGLWKFAHTDYGEKFFATYLKSDNATYGGKPLPESARKVRGDLAGAIKQICLTAEPIYVDSDMFRLAEAAFSSFVEEPLLPTDLITPSGFILLPEPFNILDAHKLTTKNRAIMWTEMDFPTSWFGGKTLRGIFLLLFSDTRDHDDWWAKITDDYKMELPIVAGNHLYLNYMTAWEYNEAREYLVPELYAGEKGSLDDLSPTRYVQALFRLMQQTISVKTKERPSRPLRKRLEKEDWKPDPRVTVITLRRPHGSPSGDHRDVEWSHRWLVAGHWRNQYYPSIKAHRQIWISPYIKGPEDMPLEIRSTRVFELVR